MHSAHFRRLMTALPFLCFLLAPKALLAVGFGQWQEIRYIPFFYNTWTQDETGVDVFSDGTISIIWTSVSPKDANTTRASWEWTVTKSVPSTSLDVKGEDDRNLALYFAFLPEDIVKKYQGASIRKLLDVKETRLLVYIWGGDEPRGSSFLSPHIKPASRSYILRSAGTGIYEENINLAKDFKEAFGEEITNLVGLAISADSDDSDTQIQARVQNLELSH